MFKKKPKVDPFMIYLDTLIALKTPAMSQRDIGYLRALIDIRAHLNPTRSHQSNITTRRYGGSTYPPGR